MIIKTVTTAKLTNINGKSLTLIIFNIYNFIMIIRNLQILNTVF